MEADIVIQRANDIAHYFASEPDRELAIIGITSHIARFWPPRMRRKLIDSLGGDGSGLDALALAAAQRLAAIGDMPAGSKHQTSGPVAPSASIEK